MPVHCLQLIKKDVDVLSPDQRAIQHQIIAALHVAPAFNMDAEIQRRTDFMG